MIIDLDAIFRYKVLNKEKLLAYGFTEDGDDLCRKVPIMKKQFWMEIAVMPGGKVSYRVIDRESGEEYVLVHAENAQGGFVNDVRMACEKVLCDVAQKCFDTETLKAEQTRRIISLIESGYGAKPEYLWEKSPDSAAIRRNDNAKWFAVIMTIDRTKLGLSGHGNIEIMDLKAKPDTVERLLGQAGIYPAYHMNKKHWFTVCLDGSLSDEVLKPLIADSFLCAGGA